ncbi:MAG: SsrA-binding protein SmpB [Pseudomonadota bacterium]|jgi:SsrA-binding protein
MNAKQPHLICENRRARFNYAWDEVFEGGLVLSGPEVKSLRAGGGQLNEAYASIAKSEVWLIGAHIAPYKHATLQGAASFDERRSRKVLLHTSQIKKLKVAREQQGMTLVPLKLYWKNGVVKVLLALAKGKNTVDKRETIKRREEERATRRIFKGARG